MAQSTNARTRKPATAKAASAPAKPAPTACKCPAPTPAIRPYIATRRLTDTRTLTGSTVVTTVTEDQESRDAYGRNRSDTLRTLPNGTQYHDEAIWDPVEKVRMSWSVGRPNTPNVVNVFPFPTGEISELNTTAPPAAPQPNRPYLPRRTESMAPQVIAGLYAEGFLTTTTTPAGTQGNDHDLISTQEVWTSPDTGIQLRTITDSPTYGKTTAETTSIQFVAPDPTVFKAPEGYEVKYATPKPAPVSTSACNCTAVTTPPTAQNVQPYTVKQLFTRVLTLANGTTITTVSNTVTARDAEGRTYNESTQTLNGETTRGYSIWDYPAQTRYAWTDSPNAPKVVTVFRPRPIQPSPTTPIPTPPLASANRRYYPNYNESLPPQTIDGVYAEGTLNTRTIPAGYQGNDRDLTTTTETWRSPDLGILIRQVTDDPRNGKSTTETTDIQRSADPARFKPPAGYALREGNTQ